MNNVRLAGMVLGVLGIWFWSGTSRGEVAETDLMRLFTRDGEVWSLDETAFMRRAGGLGYRPSSVSADGTWTALRADLRFAGLRVWESRARLTGPTVGELEFVLYSRGDAGELSRARFYALLGEVDRRLEQWTRATHVVIQQPREPGGAAVQQWAWVYGPHRFDLHYGVTEGSSREGFRAEYIRLIATPFHPDADPRKRPITTPTQHGVLTVFDLRRQVERTADGDVFVSGFPMVDQGRKGYCAVATAERLMAYYGRDVDQHEMARIADTSSTLGTDSQLMIRVLRQVGKRMGLKVTTVLDFDLDDLDRLIKDYNRLAKKTGVPQIQYGQVPDMAAIYAAMDRDLFIQARLRKTSARKRFIDVLTRHINGGIPLAWTAIVGLVPEHPRIRGGIFGHMRILIGVNERTGEVLYTDSWGRGHELKRMGGDEAWAITTGLYAVSPDNIRL